MTGAATAFPTVRFEVCCCATVERPHRRHYSTSTDAMGGIDVSAAFCCRDDARSDAGDSRQCGGGGGADSKTAGHCRGSDRALNSCNNFCSVRYARRRTGAIVGGMWERARPRPEDEPVSWTGRHWPLNTSVAEYNADDRGAERDDAECGGCAQVCQPYRRQREFRAPARS
jgi:hypothetical protein